MPAAVPSDAELRAALERALEEVGREPPVELDRQPSPYRTSFPLEKLSLTFADGERAQLACKRLDWDCLDATARMAKPRFLHDPAREPAVYRSLLRPAGLGAPLYFGAAIDEGAGRHWLFLEWVEGRELYQVGELELWRAAARWLGGAHRVLDALHGDVGGLSLIDYDAAYYRRWIERAVEFRGGAGAEGEARRGVAWLAARHDAVVEALTSLPKVVIHGEFYAANVLVSGDASAPRVAPVDWELTARAPGAIDLAALVSGDWDAEQRARLVAAYGAGGSAEKVCERELGFARLHLAVQWLGWAPPDWVPPPGQRHDWLAEALALAEELGL